MLHQVNSYIYIYKNQSETLFFLAVMNRASNIQSVPPTYPSSSKKAKDWNKLEVEIKKEEKEEKLEGDAALNQYVFVVTFTTKKT